MSRQILVTGAGSGFGKEIAIRLQQQGDSVIAGVHTYSEKSALEKEMKERNIPLRIEKLDVTDEGDRKKAAKWDIDILLNNAGLSEGGSMVDIPLENIQANFDVNVFGPIMLTQPIAKQMVKKGKGHIIFVSSVAGITTDPFTGTYAGTKHALEAMVLALYRELREFNIQINTINPGPFLTGFNDRMFETYQSWNDNPEERLFDYDKISFPHKQFEIEPVIEMALSLINGETSMYRNILPAHTFEMQKASANEDFTRDSKVDLGKRDPLVEVAYNIKPETPVESQDTLDF